MSWFADDKILEKVIMQYSGMITRIAFQYAQNRADAEDIVQEVFYTLTKQSQFNDEEHLKAWLIRATINRSKDYLRSAKRRKAVTFNNGYSSTEQDNEIFDAIQKLSDRDRNIIYLFYYEGYTAKEIANILGKKEGAITMRLTRAREKLKNILEE